MVMIILYMYRDLTFLFSAVNLIENTQVYDIFSVILPVRTVVTAVKLVWMCCGRVCGCDSNPHSQSLFLIT
jgi:hypothetical protein